MSLITITQQQDDLFIEGTLFVPLFKNNIKVYIEQEVDIKYAESCAEHFTTLSDAMIDEFCSKAIEYCEFMREEWGDFDIYDNIVDSINEKIPERIFGREILKFISSPRMYIMPPKENIPGYNIECDCVWEPEHGLDWIIRGNRTLYVGQSEGLGAWCDDDEYEDIF